MRRAQNRRIRIVISTVVWALCVYSLHAYFRKASAEGIAVEMTFGSTCMIVAQAIIVHLVKSLRLYLIIFENQIPFSRHAVIYAETTLVNLILPYKSGEIYRGYRIGQEMSSVLQGYAVVLFDRFIDTLALISAMLFIALLWNIPISSIFVIFIVFCIMFIFLYCLFPPLYKYMNHFLIFNKSSKNTLKGLYILKLCNKAYLTVNGMARGRFLFLYLFSVVAWFAEVGGLIAVRGSVGDGIGGYMMDAMLGAPSKENIVYFFICIIFFAMVSVSMRIAREFRRKKDGSTHSL